MCARRWRYARNDTRMSTPEDDAERYRQALQRSLMSDGWDELFDHTQAVAWIRRNRERLLTIAIYNLGHDAKRLIEDYITSVESYTPPGPYDVSSTKAIFQPILEAVAASAKSIGMRPTRRVDLVTSTDVSPTPFARPTTDTHQLFIGSGTSAFCNYWAKAYTAVVQSIGMSCPADTRIETYEQFLGVVAAHPSCMLLPISLSLHFAAYGTLLKFGEVAQTAAYLPYRMSLLHAMEFFSVAHEYAHFLADERGIDGARFDDNSELDHIEYFCDAIGMQISRAWAADNDDWLGFCGVGAIAFFRAVWTCEACRSLILEREGKKLSSISERGGESTHPTLEQRIGFILDYVINNTDADQVDAVTAFIKEYDTVCLSIGARVIEVVSAALGDDSSE